MVRAAFGQANDLSCILEAEQNFRRLVDDLSILARLGVGAVELRQEPVEVASLLSDLIESRDSALVARALGYDVSTPGGLAMWADRGRTAQILGHLLDNAIRFTPEGGQVRVDAASGIAGVTITVSDSGPGIPARIRTHLCRPAITKEALAGRDAHRGGEGHALGLTLCCSLARAMGGDLRVDDPAAGASVTLHLPGHEPPA